VLVCSGKEYEVSLIFQTLNWMDVGGQPCAPATFPLRSFRYSEKWMKLTTTLHKEI